MAGLGLWSAGVGAVLGALARGSFARFQCRTDVLRIQASLHSHADLLSSLITGVVIPLTVDSCASRDVTRCDVELRGCASRSR
jgi:hypothetical protein